MLLTPQLSKGLDCARRTWLSNHTNETFKYCPPKLLHNQLSVDVVSSYTGYIMQYMFRILSSGLLSG